VRKKDSLSHRLDHDIEKSNNKNRILLRKERFRILIVEKGKFWKELEDTEEFIEEKVKITIDKERER